MVEKEKKRILAAAGTVGGSTLVSRVLGAFRDMAIAWIFPVGITDVFFVAFRLPNIMRRLFGEGALTISILPVFTEVLHKDPEEAKRVYKITATLLAAALIIVVGLGMIFSRYVVLLFAPGFTASPDKFELAVSLTRLMFPFLLLVSMLAMAQGILNALNHFFTPAIAPAVLNVVMIASAVLLSGFFAEPIYGLAVGVLVGGFIQIAMQIPVLVKKGYTPGILFRLDHPAVKKILLLMGPAAFGMLVYQFNMLISTMLASLLPEGGLSWLFYAQRFTELPLGLFATALGTAVLPSLSRQRADGDEAGFKSSYKFALRITLFMMFPCAIGLSILSVPIFNVFYHHGKFGYMDAKMAGLALMAYAPGLIAISAQRLTTPVFYARQNTKTPVKIGAIAFVVNMIASVFLMGPHYICDPIFKYFDIVNPPEWYMTFFSYEGLGHIGLALATTISSWYNYIHLEIILTKQIGEIWKGEVATSVFKTIIACIPCGLVSYAIAFNGWINWESGNYTLKAAALFGSAIFGGAAFFATAYAVRCDEVVEFVGIIRRRLQRRNSASR